MAVAETRNAPLTETRTEKGVSLARGPALILGTILLAAGLYMLYKEHTFPPFSNFPNGKAPVEGKVFGVFGANGWTGMLTAVAGGLLLFGAAQHLLAKTMSLIVGIGLGAAAVIALISGDVLGLAAANHLTELAWGIAAAILLVNTLVPRRRRQVAVADDAAVATSASNRRAVPVREPAGERVGPAGERVGPAGERVAPAGERVAPAGSETRAVREPGPAGERVAPAEGETRVMHDGENTRVMNDGENADTRVVDQEPGTRAMDDGQNADTRVMDEREDAPTQRP